MHFLGDAIFRRRVDAVALEQREKVFAARELLDLAEEGVHVLVLGLVRHFLVVPGGRGKRRKARRVHLVVALRDERQRGHVDRRRDQDRAIESDIQIALEPRDQQRRANAAVAFTEDVFGRVPAVVVRDERADEFRDGVGVLVESPEIFAFLLPHRMAVAGADGIDEHEIGGAKDR